MGSVKSKETKAAVPRVTPEAVAAMRTWLFEVSALRTITTAPAPPRGLRPQHFEHPYPSDAVRQEFATAHHMSAQQASGGGAAPRRARHPTVPPRAQVGNWFINARMRLWRPAVRGVAGESLDPPRAPAPAAPPAPVSAPAAAELAAVLQAPAAVEAPTPARAPKRARAH